ncbi:MAG: hypothetical protein LBV71_06420 [Prevotella sp.]|jgi:hypothetical protein|nr:hypothetical protein [Prevotella sp.]
MKTLKIILIVMYLISVTSCDKNEEETQDIKYDIIGTSWQTQFGSAFSYPVFDKWENGREVWITKYHMSRTTIKYTFQNNIDVLFEKIEESKDSYNDNVSFVITNTTQKVYSYYQNNYSSLSITTNETPSNTYEGFIENNKMILIQPTPNISNDSVTYVRIK